MRLVYLSPVPWASFAQRPHRLIEWFHERTEADVFWIDPYPARFPKWRDLQAVMRSQRRLDGVGRAIPPWLTVVAPSAAPIEPLPGSGWLNGILWRGVHRQVRAFVSVNELNVLAIGKPSVLALQLAQLNRLSVVLYDAMDDFPAFFTGISRWSMEGRQRRIVDAVMTLWVSSTPLLHRWASVRPDARLVPNGLASNALTGLRRLPRRGKPVFGYVGTIGDWFDWRWVLDLADVMHDAEIRLIGPVHTAVPASLPANVRMLAPCDHHIALLHMQEFDVGLIPFVRSRLTAAVDPIKYYEYRALGLAVLSTDFGQMSYRRGETGVYLTDDGPDLSRIASLALEYVADRVAIEAFRREVDWYQIFDSSGLLDRLRTGMSEAGVR